MGQYDSRARLYKTIQLYSELTGLLALIGRLGYSTVFNEVDQIKLHIDLESQITKIKVKINEANEKEYQAKKKSK